MRQDRAHHRTKLGVKIVSALVAAIFGGIMALWSTYALLGVNLPLFLACLLATAALSAVGLYLFMTRLSRTIQEIHQYIQHKKQTFLKTGRKKTWMAFLIGLIMLILALTSFVGVLGYFTYELIGAQFHGLLVSHLNLPHVTAKYLVIISLAIVVPLSMGMKFFDLFKPFMTHRSGAEHWVKKNGKNPVHWILFAVYAVGSFFLSWPMVGVLLAGHQHFLLFVMDQFYLAPVHMALTTMLAMALSLVITRALILLHVKVNQHIKNKFKGVLTIQTVCKSLLALLLSAMSAISSLWTIHHFQIWGKVWESSRWTDALTVASNAISPTLDMYRVMTPSKDDPKGTKDADHVIGASEVLDASTWSGEDPELKTHGSSTKPST